MTSPARLPSRLCFITDSKVSEKTAEEMTLSALMAGVRWVQYREKEKSRKHIYEEARRLRQLTLGYGAALIVNDHADIALAVDADGVHLGQDDLPLREARKILGKKIIGISTHCLAEALSAAAGGADYIGFGPLFHTKTKEKAGEPRGLETLRQIRQEVHVPIVAIGGISSKDIKQLFAAGADAVAVASAILIGDISANVAAFMHCIEGGVRSWGGKRCSYKRM
jgi:thiamine-phosphate pyrophosphorylase